MNTDLPLAGIRVVDLTRVLSGPFCSMLLGDLGADVIKVETPGEGDTVRHQGAGRDGLSWYFANYNRNKRSITLNLRSEAGRDILARLIAKSDVLIDNYRPGVLDAMGFDRGSVCTNSTRAWCAAASPASATTARIATGPASISSRRR